MGSSLEVKNTDNRLVLIDDNSALAADGLYYASWGIGNAQPYSAITISPIRWRYMNNDLKNSQVWILNHL